MATGTSLSHVFPLGSRLNERGRLEVGGCDTIELAREFGTPAYVVAEDDLRAARARLRAGRARRRPRGLPRGVRLQGVPLHRRARAVRAGGAVVRRRLRRRAAPGAGRGLRARADRDARQRQVRGRAADGAARTRRADRDRQLRRDRPPRAAARPSAARRREPQPVLVRVTPDVRGETHEKISTGQADSKFGFAMADAPAAIERVRGDRRAWRCGACTRTSARSCSSWSRSAARSPSSPQLGDFPV